MATNSRKVVEELLEKFPKTYSEELEIDLKSGKEKEIFKWFLASILFGKRISETIAKNTYKEFEKEKLLTPDKILEAGWNKLVRVLDDGGYVRYDFSTASKLLDIMKNLKEKYGTLQSLHEKAKDSKDLEKRLLEFKGVGPVTVNIFLRELRCVWQKANPEVIDFVESAARKLGINLEKLNKKTWKFIRLESALVRMRKQFQN